MVNSQRAWMIIFDIFYQGIVDSLKMSYIHALKEENLTLA